MLEQIQAALAKIAGQYGDKRTQVCQVEAAARAENEYTLTGKVLDGQTLAAVTAYLAQRFPAASLDTGSVQVLRRESTPALTVITNLTGLYAGPSFLAERSSQVLNGWELECLEELESWAFIRQPDGYLGWVYRPYLAEMPAPATTHVVSRPIGLLRIEPDQGAALAGRLVGGTAVLVTATMEDWSQVRLVGGLVGWLHAQELRALDPMFLEETWRRKQIVADGLQFIGVPYLWGGCSALGIDCSGLAQLLHRLVGITLPRDADMQFEAGSLVEPPYRTGDLFFFGSDEGYRSISHVAISLGGWRILHASRSVNGVYTDDVQANPWLRDHFLGARTFLA